MLRVAFMGCCLLLLIALTGCGGDAGKRPAFADAGGKVKVATSFYPIYEFAKAVGGDKADLVNLVPPGTEPHDWEPTAGDLKILNDAALFVYNGAGMEHWVPKTLQSLDNKAQITVEASRGIDLLRGQEGEEAEEWDPHVWLDPQGAIREVEAIRDGFIQVDAANRQTYEENAAKLIAELTHLDEEYRAGLASCRTNRFFTSHSAFGYLARRYGLEQHAIMGLAPDAEPAPKDLARIVGEAKALGVKQIFFETLVSDKVARLVAEEIGAGTLVLNPFEGLTPEEVEAGKNYAAIMRENLANLQIALECGK